MPKAYAEDGYELWLRYRPLPAAIAASYAASVTELALPARTPTQRAAADELRRGLHGLLGRDVPASSGQVSAGAMVVGTPASSAIIGRLEVDVSGLGADGYLIRQIELDGKPITVVAARHDIGALYGVFHLLRRVQLGEPLHGWAVVERPRLQRRVLDHWDDLDRHVERGYAGQSLWDWHKLPGYVDPRYLDYARANASIGINGVVLNNVNADALSLSPAYLRKAAALADVFRPYGIRVYLSARFSAPIELGRLETADPLAPAVQDWWRRKTEEVYRYIPDFGGYLVKANSEGQPGPQDYGRSHADGANLLADALAPHGGIVMWRAFVYSHEVPTDRAAQAYDEFVPLDGAFHSNVILQVKNGPIDFQPREPFHPLFGAMERTPLMLELQITKEYLGFATHLAYLGPLYQEVLQSDTHAGGEGMTVARVIEGDGRPDRLTGIAGVANIGTDRNWCGSVFDQANWYVFGRLAWDPQQSVSDIAGDWVRMTFSRDPRFVTPVVEMMMRSRQAVVDYMTPLGLHHLMAEGHHYGPGPWVADAPRADWTSVYYHRADRDGIGFDRSAGGSNAVAQYAPPLASRWGDPATTPEDLLLWFHHLPWDYRMASGRSLWDELVLRYGRGVKEVAAMQATWRGLSGFVDAARYAQVADFLAIQREEAQWWCDASVAYFQHVSGRPLPAGSLPPPHTLEYYESLSFPYAPGN